MEVSLKYQIFDFLDNSEEHDYIRLIQMVSKRFQLPFKEAESYVRWWFHHDPQYIFYYELMQEMAEMCHLNLEIYLCSKEFWMDILDRINPQTLQLLKFLSQRKWLGEVNGLLNIEIKTEALIG